MKSRKGIALMTALSVGAILAVLAGATLALMLEERAFQRRQQRLVQAYWAARAGLERYRAAGELPEPDPQTGERLLWSDGSYRCTAAWKGADLILEGRCQNERRLIVLKNGNPERREEPNP